MRAPLCCLQHSHVYQKMRELLLLPTTDSLNRRGKEQLKKATEHQQCLKCPAWGGVVVKLLPVKFPFFSTAAFTILDYPLKMHLGQWPVFSEGIANSWSKEFGIYIFVLRFQVILWDLLSVSEQSSKGWSQLLLHQFVQSIACAQSIFGLQALHCLQQEVAKNKTRGKTLKFIYQGESQF